VQDFRNRLVYTVWQNPVQ